MSPAEGAIEKVIHFNLYSNLLHNEHYYDFLASLLALAFLIIIDPIQSLWPEKFFAPYFHLLINS